MEVQQVSPFPAEVAWAQYHEEGTNSGAVAAQFAFVGVQHPDQALGWGEDAARAVALPRRIHTSCPPVLASLGPLTQRQEEAAAHPGLWGVHHDAFITGGKFEGAQARGNCVATSKGFRKYGGFTAVRNV